MLSPFYDGSCGRNYQIGWPMAAIQYESTGLSHELPQSFLTESWHWNSQLILTVVCDLLFAIVLGMAITWLFKRVRGKFHFSSMRFSGLFVFYYSALFFTTGWFLLLYNPAPSGVLRGIIEILYLYPVLYTGGIVALFINQHLTHAKSYAVFPYAYLIAILVYFLAFYKAHSVIVGYKQGKLKRE